MRTHVDAMLVTDHGVRLRPVPTANHTEALRLVTLEGHTYRLSRPNIGLGGEFDEVPVLVYEEIVEAAK